MAGSSCTDWSNLSHTLVESTIFDGNQIIRILTDSNFEKSENLKSRGVQSHRVKHERMYQISRGGAGSLISIKEEWVGEGSSL